MYWEEESCWDFWKVDKRQSFINYMTRYYHNELFRRSKSTREYKAGTNVHVFLPWHSKQTRFRNKMFLFLFVSFFFHTAVLSQWLYKRPLSFPTFIDETRLCSKKSDRLVNLNCEGRFTKSWSPYLEINY